MSTRSQARLHWFMILLIVAMFCAVLLYLIHRLTAIPGQLLGQVTSVPGQVAHALAGAFKPEIQTTTLLQSTLTNLQRQPKLVVLTFSCDVMVTKHTQTNTLWGLAYLGTTTVKIRAAQNKAQYYIPLDQLRIDHWRYIPQQQTLLVIVPTPRLDDQIVQVQIDPSLIEIQTDYGWTQIDRLKGDFLRDQARSDLRPAVLMEGSKVMYQELAAENAEKVLRRLFTEQLAPSLQPGVKIMIRFESPSKETAARAPAS